MEGRDTDYGGGTDYSGGTDYGGGMQRDIMTNFMHKGSYISYKFLF